MKYEPLSARAVKRIQDWDMQYHQGDNRNRFYTWLVQVGQDIQIRHVAVKAKKGAKRPMVKEVARFSVEDDQMHVKDLVFYHGGGGYAADWRPEGLGYAGFPASYDGWESEDYRPTGLWHIQATVINPHLLNRTKRFKYCNWWSRCGDIVNYLKTYVDHPGIELLSKLGLANWTQKPSIYKKCEQEKAFARFLFRNSADIRECHYKIPSVLKAYREGRSIRDVVDEQAQKEMEAKRVDEDKLAEVAEAWSWLESLGRKYRIRIPRTHKEFIHEGVALEHCVLREHYAQKMSKGKSIIVFIRQKDHMDTPFVTVEYDLKQAKVTQCYGYRNSKPEKGVQSFVDRSFAHAKQIAIKEEAA